MVSIARDLLGKVLVTRRGDVLTSVMITETEAYAGVGDKASHAYGGRRTARTEVMYREGGVCYVFLCYGIHHLFNVTTNRDGVPHAILIRAGEPIDGVETMKGRRGKTNAGPTLTAGPGALSMALGIFTADTGKMLTVGDIWIEDRGIQIDREQIIADTRVGVAYAGDDALLPYRFSIAGNRYVSKAKGLTL